MQVLHTLLCPRPGLPAALYLAGTWRLEEDDAGHSALGLDAGQRLSTDTFFGAFYRAYWWRHTPVRDFALRPRVEGAARIDVYETAGGLPERIASMTLQAGDQQCAAIPLPAGSGDPDAGSRIHVEVHALGPCLVHGLDIVTEAPPRARQATLSVGLCTFNREGQLAQTLERLAELAATEPALRQVYIVNQGAPFQSEAMLRLLKTPGFVAITQRNLGGAGGFTRSLLEARAAPDRPTHHLLMDDDILLDERFIRRALRFLDNVTEDVALGAGMLDGMRPTVMYEAGATLLTENRISPHCQDVDLSAAGGEAAFDIPKPVDFNAWWFCALPLARCDDVGFPLPVFIRGDDFEYGQRLAEAGVETITLPGIGVWHEPFYAKPAGWQHYYDLRNRLIFAATHPRKVDQLSVAHIVGMITAAILTHDYRTARLRLRALADFLSGPDALFGQDPETLHADILALARRDAPQAVEAAHRTCEPRAADETRHQIHMTRLVREHALSLIRTGLGPLRAEPGPVLLMQDVRPARTAGRAYIATNRLRGFHHRLVPRRGHLWTLTARAVLAGLRYWMSRGAVGRSWAARAPHHQTETWWRATMRLPPAPHKRSASEENGPAS